MAARAADARSGVVAVAFPGEVAILRLGAPAVVRAAVDASRVAVCPGGDLVAAAAGKEVLLLRSDEGTVALRLAAPKRMADVAFVDRDVVLFADRFGDVFSGRVREGAAAEPAHALGHVSPMTTLAFDAARGFVISADLDHRIRVSRWPAAYDVAAFCLGHTAPVSHICTLPLETSPGMDFLTAGDDGAIRGWRVDSEELVASVWPAREGGTAIFAAACVLPSSPVVVATTSQGAGRVDMHEVGPPFIARPDLAISRDEAVVALREADGLLLVFTATAVSAWAVAGSGAAPAMQWERGLTAARALESAQS